MSTRIDSASEVTRLPRSEAGARTAKPLIAHIIFSLDVGGLENGLVNLINHMPGRYRHVVICLSHFTDFRNRINRPGVRVLALHKRPGKDFGMYVRLWRLLKRLRPDIVHTRNYGALDSALIAALAGVPIRVHGEHGWDMADPYGGSIKYRLLRRSLGPLIQRHIAVSRDIGDWLKDRIRIPASRVLPICNGVDTEAFCPSVDNACDWRREAGSEFAPDKFIIGTIGRMDAVKDQPTLVRAFACLLREQPELRERVRLVVIGDGPGRDDVLALIRRENLSRVSWLPGRRDDVSRLLCGMDLFVLPSLNEGISNTILEAMACGRPVVATRVGGNPELVVDGETGTLVPPSNPAALARAMARYALDPALAQRAGRAGRERVEREFSLYTMVGAYTRLYDNLLEG